MALEPNGYDNYRLKVKHELYRFVFIACFFLCVIYFFINVQDRSFIDAAVNLLAIVLSSIGLYCLHAKVALQYVHVLPAVIFCMLYLGYFAGAGMNPDATSLLWCLLFIPALILTLGHRRSPPYLVLIFTFTIGNFYIAPISWVSIEYSADEKFTFIVTALLLTAITLYSEYTRYSLSKNVYHGTLERERIQYLSYHDELTGLLNRRGFNEEIVKQPYLDKRFTDQNAVILIDIDNFKQVNDTYGHSFGDLVLKNISRLQKASVRSTDKIVRWGGEEFLIILHNIAATEVERIAENIRKNIEKTPVANEKHKISVTVSLGIAYYQECQSMEELIALADERLYIAKANDKNCIVAAS